MKDIDKKDLPDVSGGVATGYPITTPYNPLPGDDVPYPPEPTTPVDPWITDPPAVDNVNY